MIAVARVRAPDSPTTTLVDPLKVFIARTEARAMLWQAGEFDLQEAVNALQAAAVRDGLVDSIGQDAVQEILSQAFARVR